MSRRVQRTYDVNYTVTCTVTVPDATDLEYAKYENVSTLWTNEVLSDDIARQHRLLNDLLNNEPALNQFLEYLATSIVEDGVMPTERLQPSEERVLEQQAIAMREKSDAHFFSRLIQSNNFIDYVEHVFNCIQTNVVRDVQLREGEV